MSTTTTNKPKTTRSSTRKPLPDTSVAAGAMSAVEALAAADDIRDDAGILRWLDPKQLLIGVNIRTDTKLPTSFIESIRENGVRVPIRAHETAQGIEVIDGQLRTLAAVEAEVDLVPVFVVPLENDQERVVDQLVTNRERIDMSRADTVAAVHQLAFDLKMPADQIAKRTRIPRDQVDAAVKVAGAVAVVAALDNVEREITLDFAARIVDAELTVEETQRVVTSRFNPEQELKNVLRARELLTSIAALTAQVNATSTPLVDQPNRGSQASEFSGSDSTKNRHLWIARLADVKTDKALTEAAHASCPGHAAAIAGGGYYGGGEPTVRYLCTDPKKYGHYDMQKAKPAPPLTDEQRVAKAARVELERQWPDVVETRRTFLRVVLQRPKLPEGWEILTALIETEAIRAGNWNSPRFDSPALAFDLLGHAIPGTTGQGEHVRTLLAKNPKLAPKLLLARALAYVETGISTKKDLDTTPPEYLEQLVAWGYELTEAEAALAKGR